MGSARKDSDGHLRARSGTLGHLNDLSSRLPNACLSAPAMDSTVESVIGLEDSGAYVHFC
jgi:hypothetical protein